MTAPPRTVLPERNLDVLRALAVLFVIADHTAGIYGASYPATQWMGHAGVLAFFVHTSLVLMASLERDGAPGRAHWVARFYVRRAWRIYPLAWAVILVVYALRIPAGGVMSPYHYVPLSTLAANLALAQSFVGSVSILAPLWTLPLELQMYLALPLCYLVARKWSPGWIAGLLLFGVALASFYVFGRHLRFVWRLRVLEFVPAFLMGVLAYWSLRRRRGTPPPLPSWAWVPIIFVDLALVGVAYNAWHHEWLLRIVFCGILGAAIPLVRDLVPSAFTRAAHTVATYSYGIYLLHLLALRIGFGVLRDMPIVVRAVVAIGVLIVTAYAAYHLIEKPGIAFGQRLVGPRNRVDSLESTAPAP